MTRKTKPEILPLIDKIYEVDNMNLAAKLMRERGLVMISAVKGGNGACKYVLAHCSLRRAAPLFLPEVISKEDLLPTETDAPDSTEFWA